MALFGTRKYKYASSTRSTGVSRATRAARARKGHNRRAAHLYASSGAKKGRRTTYRKGGGHLF